MYNINMYNYIYVVPTNGTPLVYLECSSNVINGPNRVEAGKKQYDRYAMNWGTGIGVRGGVGPLDEGVDEDGTGVSESKARDTSFITTTRVEPTWNI